MRIIIFSILFALFVNGVFNSTEGYRAITGFHLNKNKEDLHVLSITTFFNQKEVAATVKMALLPLNILDSLKRPGYKSTIYADKVHINGKYKIMLPDGRLLAFSLKKPDNIVELFVLALHPLNIPVFIYSEPAFLVKRYFGYDPYIAHNSWYLDMNFLTEMESDAIKNSECIYMRKIERVMLVPSFSFPIRENAFYAFPLGTDRFVAIQAKANRESKDHELLILVTNFSPASKKFMEQYTSLDTEKPRLPTSWMPYVWTLGVIMAFFSFTHGILLILGAYSLKYGLSWYFGPPASSKRR
jgi:hypothetical protein